MNTAYIYLQLYKLFDDVTPVPVDCGQLCDKACCKGDDRGMFLFPGEKEVFNLLNPDWVRIEKTDFTYDYNGKTYTTPIAMCQGYCDRYQPVGFFHLYHILTKTVIWILSLTHVQKASVLWLKVFILKILTRFSLKILKRHFLYLWKTSNLKPLWLNIQNT